jgi:hypothetical protein
MTPPSASDPHRADCGPRTTSMRDRRSVVRSSKRASLPAAGSLKRNPVNEQQCMICLCAPDPNLRLRAARAGGGNGQPGREPEQIARHGQRQGLDGLAVEQARRHGRVFRRDRLARRVTTICWSGPAGSGPADASNNKDSIISPPTTAPIAVSEDPEDANARPEPRIAGWTRPDADDKRRQVSWLCGSPPGLSLKESGLAAYSCGHSAGSSPASLFTGLAGRHLRCRAR